MYSNEICKKIVYAIEQTAGARWYHGVDKIDEELSFRLDAALEYLREALKAAANAK
jgi:hypothetical protein